VGVASAEFGSAIAEGGSLNCELGDAVAAASRPAAHTPISLLSNAPFSTNSCGTFAPLSPFSTQMRMEVRTEECRRRAAECAQKALCQSDPAIRQMFADLAEQWRALAEQAEFLQQYH
jgi:hypothetical protein